MTMTRLADGDFANLPHGQHVRREWASLAEPIPPDAAEERAPLGAGDRQDWSGGVLGVPHRDLIGQPGHLDAVALDAAITRLLLRSGMRQAGRNARYSP